MTFLEECCAPELRVEDRGKADAWSVVLILDGGYTTQADAQVSADRLIKILGPAIKQRENLSCPNWPVCDHCEHG